MTPTRQPKIVGLGGSLATQSTSLAALKIALQGAADAGADVELLDVRQLDLPFYVPGAEAAPPSALRLVEAAAGSDLSFLISALETEKWNPGSCPIRGAITTS